MHDERWRQRRLGAALLAGALFLAACQQSPAPLPTATVEMIVATETPPASVTPTPSRTPTLSLRPTPTLVATQTPLAIRDCFWSAAVTAWEDSDGDGQRGAAELPLAGIPVVMLRPGVGPLRNALQTDEAGVARFYLGTSCPMEEYGVEVQVPPGYRATTPVHLTGIGSLVLRVGLIRE
jgi:hypothetical protein